MQAYRVHKRKGFAIIAESKDTFYKTHSKTKMTTVKIRPIGLCNSKRLIMSTFLYYYYLCTVIVRFMHFLCLRICVHFSAVC